MKAEAPIGCRRCGSPVGYGPSVDRRGGIYPARGCLPRRGGAGRCEHRPLQGLAARQGCRFPAGRGPSVDRRGGIYPARGVCAAAGVRRDEGIPPYGRPGGHSRSGLVWSIKFIRRGGFHIRPGCLRRRGVPGPIWNRPLQRFAIPQKARFPGWYGPSVGRRGGIYPARGLAATQGPRDDLQPKSRACGPVGLRNAPAGAVQASSPTEVCCNGGPQFPGWPRHSPSSVGVDSISARGRLRRAECGGMRASRPTVAWVVAAVPVWSEA